MAKARDVLRKIQKAGWHEISCKGSHRKLKKGDETRTFAYHDAHELGKVQLAIVAKEFGLTVEELR